MVDMTLKTRLPTVLMDNVLTEFSVWRNHPLPLVGGAFTDPNETGNLLKYASKDPQITPITIEGKKCAEVWYGCGNSTYYYKLPGESRFRKVGFENSFVLGDSAVVASMGSGYPVFNVGHDMAGVSCDKPNFMVDGVWTKGIIIATKDEPELGNKFGDVWYQTGPATYVKAKDRTITYSDNPTTGVAEPHVIDLTKSIEKPINFSPNPASDHVNLDFVLGKNDTVSVLVYNMHGQAVSTPVNQQNLPAGKQQVTLDTHDWPPGAYLVKIQGKSGEPQLGSFVVER